MVQKRTEIPSTTEGPSLKRKRTQIPENLLENLSVDAKSKINNFVDKITALTPRSELFATRFFFLIIKCIIQEFFRDLKENTLQLLFDLTAVYYGTRLILCRDIDNTLLFWDTYADVSSIFEDSLTKIIPWVFQNFSWAEPDLFLKQVIRFFNKHSKLCLQDFHYNTANDKGLVLHLPAQYEWGEYDSPLSGPNFQLIHTYKEKYRKNRKNKKKSNHDDHDHDHENDENDENDDENDRFSDYE
jgi:hypothetical protein